MLKQIQKSTLQHCCFLRLKRIFPIFNFFKNRNKYHVVGFFVIFCYKYTGVFLCQLNHEIKNIKLIILSNFKIKCPSNEILSMPCIRKAVIQMQQEIKCNSNQQNFKQLDKNIHHSFLVGLKYDLSLAHLILLKRNIKQSGRKSCFINVV